MSFLKEASRKIIEIIFGVYGPYHHDNGDNDPSDNDSEDYPVNMFFNMFFE